MTWNSSVAMNLDAHRLSAGAECHTDRPEHRHAADDQAEYARAIGAERHADPDLRALATDGIRRDSVEPECREQQREPAEEPAEDRHEALAPDGAAKLIGHEANRVARFRHRMTNRAAGSMAPQPPARRPTRAPRA